MATNFFKRWSEKKLTDSNQESEPDVGLTQPQDMEPDVEHEAFCEPSLHDDSEEEVQEQALSFLDVESINGDSSVSAFLAKGVEKELKKAALRKMFLSDEFNVVDGLNDYDHDYSAVKTLSSDVAEGLRNWVKETVSEPEKEGEQETEQVTQISEPETPHGDASLDGEITESAINTESDFNTEQLPPLGDATKKTI